MGIRRCSTATVRAQGLLCKLTTILWSQNFGNSSTSNSAAVPEPSSLLLLLGLGAVLGLRQFASRKPIPLACDWVRPDLTRSNHVQPLAMAVLVPQKKNKVGACGSYALRLSMGTGCYRKEILPHDDRLVLWHLVDKT